MKGRDPLLGPAPEGRHEPLLGKRPGRRSWRERAPWILHGHIAIAVATLIGWEHLDLIWPTSLLPDGVSIGGERQMAGLLTVGDRGRPARLASSADLIDDWRRWVRWNERQDSSRCLAVPEAVRKRLSAGAPARPGSAGAVQYWVEIRAKNRLGPARCDQNGGLEIARGLTAIETMRAVPCSRDAFVAHGFVCPGDRRSQARQSETVPGESDYYPAAAARAGLEGSVQVRVQRDDTGSPVGCSVLKSSGHAELDVQACKLVGTDPHFTYAATAKAPEALSLPITQIVTWRLPKERAPNRATSASPPRITRVR